jgi:hypothetical protein
MSATGYSDRINHALAYAAKHHAQQVWKGSSRVPYFTYPANVAIILTRYGQDDDTVIAGILHEIVCDNVRDGQTAEMLQERIGEKFGSQIVDSLLSVVERRVDDEGVELSLDERKEDLLERLDAATERAKWIVAVGALHSGSSLLADLRRTAYPETVWARHPMDRADVAKTYRRTFDRLSQSGFTAPIMQELGVIVGALEQLASDEAGQPAPRLAL